MLLALEHTKTVLKDLVLPPSGPLLLALIGLLALRWRPFLAGCLLAAGVLSLLLLSMPVISYDLVEVTQRFPALDLDKPAGAQAIVILGGGGEREYAPEYGGPAPGPYLLEKLTYGAYVARRTGLPLLLTGWHVETAAMRDSLQRNFGLTPRWVDDQAYDTFDNARNAARLLRTAGVHRIILITTTLHMWRAAHEFTATGLQVVPAPMEVTSRRRRNNQLPLLDYVPDSQALVRSSDAVYELLAERVRVLLAMTHLRRQQPLAAPGHPPSARLTPDASR